MTADHVTGTQALCARTMDSVGKGLANQDEEKLETQAACMRNLHRFWWPSELPGWTAAQWCTETWKHEVVTTELIPNVHGKKVLITGGDTGLGFATMKALSQSGADVSYTSRTCECESNPYTRQWPQQCTEISALRAAVQEKFGFALTCYTLDLLTGESVTSFIHAVQRDYRESGLDALVNNACLVDSSPSTGNIFNAKFIGTYATTKGLWNLLLATAESGRDVRILTTTSVERLVINQNLARQAFEFWTKPDDNYTKALLDAQHFLEVGIDDLSTQGIPVGYSLSKLADLLFAMQLQELVQDSPRAKNITVFSTHPGASHTLMTRNVDVAQMTRDQGVLPNLLAIAQDLKWFNEGYPNFIGPALNQMDLDHYIQSDAAGDDNLKQFELASNCAAGLLDDSQPVQALSCLQMVGFPAQYSHLRKVESNQDLRRRIWEIAEKGLLQIYSEALHFMNFSWVGLNIPDESSRSHKMGGLVKSKASFVV